MMTNKAEVYRQMLAYLDDRGAELGHHLTARLAGAESASFPDMGEVDLIHYQRVLEATIDAQSKIMDRTAMREELAQIMHERWVRGFIEDRDAELLEFRARVASLR